MTVSGEEIRAWLKTLGVLAAIAAALTGVLQYKAALEAEKSQRLSSQTNTDIGLSQAFAILLRTASGWGESKFVESCAAKLTGGPNSQALGSCVVTFPVGKAQEIGSIAAIGTLGRQYPVLREPAVEGLRELAREYSSDPQLADATRHALREVVDLEGTK